MSINFIFIVIAVCRCRRLTFNKIMREWMRHTAHTARPECECFISCTYAIESTFVNGSYDDALFIGFFVYRVKSNTTQCARLLVQYRVDGHRDHSCLQFIFFASISVDSFLDFMSIAPQHASRLGKWASMSTPISSVCRFNDIVYLVHLIRVSAFSAQARTPNVMCVLKWPFWWLTMELRIMRVRRKRSQFVLKDFFQWSRC